MIYSHIMNEFLVLDPQDNTDIGLNIHQTYAKGYSEYSRLFKPNQGVDAEGDVYHYFPYGSIFLNNKIIVHNNHVFAKNGQLTKPGIIVEKHYIDKKQDGIELGSEQYFRVISSNAGSVPTNSLVIVMADQGYRFNYKKSQYFFVQTDKILVVMNEAGVTPGPANLLLKYPEPEMIGCEVHEPLKGSLDGEIYYFMDALYDLEINNEKFSVVAKKDVKVVC